MKKIILAVFLFSFIFIPTLTQAGVVSCGLSVDDPGLPGDQTIPCGFCQFFVLIDNLLDFVMIKFVPVVAVLMMTIGGVMFFFAGNDPKYLQKGKDIVTSTVIGLVIIFAAFLIIGTILSAFGLTGWTHDLYKNWWQEGFFQIPGC